MECIECVVVDYNKEDDATLFLPALAHDLMQTSLDAADLRVQVGMYVLLATWIYNSPISAAAFLKEAACIQFVRERAFSFARMLRLTRTDACSWWNRSCILRELIRLFRAWRPSCLGFAMSSRENPNRALQSTCTEFLLGPPAKLVV